MPYPIAATMARGSKGQNAATAIVPISQDTHIRAGTPDGEGGDLTVISARGDGTFFNILLWADLSVIPVGATVVSAQLVVAQSSSPTNTVTVRRILAANAGWIEDCTWNFADGAGASDRWAGDAAGDGGADAGCSVAGTDSSATVAGTWSPAGGLAGTLNYIDLDPAEVQLMLAANHGLVLQASVNAACAIRSSEYADPAYRPYLSITYR